MNFEISTPNLVICGCVSYWDHMMAFSHSTGWARANSTCHCLLSTSSLKHCIFWCVHCAEKEDHHRSFLPKFSTLCECVPVHIVSQHHLLSFLTFSSLLLITILVIYELRSSSMYKLFWDILPHLYPEKN